MIVFLFCFCQLLYSREDSALILNLSIRKLDELIADGRIKPRRIDGAVRISIGELVRFADQDGDGHREVVTDEPQRDDHDADKRGAE